MSHRISPRPEHGRRTGATSDPLRVLVDREQGRLAQATHGSAEAFVRASRSLPGGVTSDFQSRLPYPIYLVRGNGAQVWDVDGSPRVDFHAAAGSLLAGHANPQLLSAITDALPRGTCFAAASEHAIPVADALRERFDLPLWRFTSSGTEAVMGAVRIARAVTKRDVVVRIAGSYNGHADSLLVGVAATESVSASRAEPGVPRAVADLTIVLPFNDVAALEETLARRANEIACVIVELPLCTPHVELPTPAFLSALRSLTEALKIVLVIDDVKTGLALGRGGSPLAFNIRPDIITLAKSLTGGLPCGAIGGRSWIMDRVGRDRIAIYGTMNGNPVAMAAAQEMLDRILTAATHDRIDRLNDRLGSRLGEIAARSSLHCSIVTRGGKGGLRLFDGSDAERGRHPERVLTELLWTFLMNRGIYLAPDPDTRWTVTAAHSEDDIDLFCSTFDQFAVEVSEVGASPRRPAP